jgi:CheY-like chemotaxis protein
MHTEVQSVPRRVLVVDDNEDTASVLSEVLQALGHQARCAFDGPSALELARTWRPDLALLDIGLPGMDGYQLAVKLREMPHLHELRLIAVTGYDQPAERQREVALGFADHLVKPFSIDVLARAVAARPR